jgi:hypothetical protein
MRFNATLLSGVGLLLATSLVFGQSSQTITGTVTDSMCGRKHMMKDASAAKCTRVCVKAGSDFALIAGDKLFTLQGDKTAIDKFAGEKVAITGKTNGNVIKVQSIRAIE